ncbi:hypothetical protein B277_02341 [Janibacter hoylei PVAS-1]|uniref:Secreted protein n=1 Tax=Janibacter hoylei PVAS-1 TaxID=1210046 RepID=K1ETD4_9MICO|nr:hypothetical protein [Janibacter hoylei]EKA62393.1 hypothetical protein B277_02341 [Janibacter hoylei PVAS-1]RWU82190.1 hypothetical protein CWN80_13235 [Janibacter hoylei PVAS-1]
MTQDITTTGPSRRSIAKGAAWAVPSVAVAAAAPSLAASTEPPCAPQTCAYPLVSALQVIATRNANNTSSSISFTGAITAAITPCTGLLSLGVATLRRVEVTWQSRAARPPYTGSGISATTTTTSSNYNLALGVNAAGALIIPTLSISVPNVRNIQSGVYADVVVGSLPSRPTRLCFDIDYTRIIGGGLPPQECQARVCIDTAVLVAVGVISNIGGGVATFTVADIGGAR